MFVEDLKFGGGLGFFRDTQIYLFPANYFITLFKLGLDNLPNNVWKSSIKNMSKEDSYILYKKYGYLKKRQVFENFLDHIKYFGFGELKLGIVSENKLSFNLVNSPYSNYFKVLYGYAPEILFEEILSGFLENYFSLVYGKKTSCRIISLGIKLTFELDILDEDYNLNLDVSYPEFKKGDISLPFQKMLHAKALTLENGFLLVSGMKAFNVPYFFFLNCIKSISSSEKLTENFYSLGYAQGKAAHDLHKYFGMASGDEVFKSVVGLMDLSCMGRFEEIDCDFRNVIIVNNINYYSKYFDNKFLTIFNKHISFMYKSIYDFSYDENTKIEYKSFSNFYLKNNKIGTELYGFTEKLTIYLTTKVLISDKI